MLSVSKTLPQLRHALHLKNQRELAAAECATTTPITVLTQTIQDTLFPTEAHRRQLLSMAELSIEDNANMAEGGQSSAAPAAVPAALLPEVVSLSHTWLKLLQESKQEYFMQGGAGLLQDINSILERHGGDEASVELRLELGALGCAAVFVMGFLSSPAAASSSPSGSGSNSTSTASPTSASSAVAVLPPSKGGTSFSNNLEAADAALLKYHQKITTQQFIVTTLKTVSRRVTLSPTEAHLCRQALLFASLSPACDNAYPIDFPKSVYAFGGSGLGTDLDDDCHSVAEATVVEFSGAVGAALAPTPPKVYPITTIPAPVHLLQHVSIGMKSNTTTPSAIMDLVLVSGPNSQHVMVCDSSCLDGDCVVLSVSGTRRAVGVEHGDDATNDKVDRCQEEEGPLPTKEASTSSNGTEALELAIPRQDSSKATLVQQPSAGEEVAAEAARTVTCLSTMRRGRDGGMTLLVGVSTSRVLGYDLQTVAKELQEMKIRRRPKNNKTQGSNTGEQHDTASTDDFRHLLWERHDPSQLGIRTVTSLLSTVVVVGPVVRLLRPEDDADSTQENPFHKLQNAAPPSAFSPTAVLLQNLEALSPDTSALILGSRGNSVEVWDAERGVLVSKYQHIALKDYQNQSGRAPAGSGFVVSLAVDRIDQTVYIGTDDGQVTVWDPISTQILQRIDPLALGIGRGGLEVPATSLVPFGGCLYTVCSTGEVSPIRAYPLRHTFPYRVCVDPKKTTCQSLDFTSPIWVSEMEHLVGGGCTVAAVCFTALDGTPMIITTTSDATMEARELQLLSTLA